MHGGMRVSLDGLAWLEHGAGKPRQRGDLAVRQEELGREGGREGGDG